MLEWLFCDCGCCTGAVNAQTAPVPETALGVAQKAAWHSHHGAVGAQSKEARVVGHTQGREQNISGITRGGRQRPQPHISDLFVPKFTRRG